MTDSSSIWDDITPDFSDPSQMAVFGALGNVLATGAAPRYTPQGQGVTGGSWANALAALTGAGLQGMNQGANFAQNYQTENLANQNAQVINPIAQQTAGLNLQRQQAIQPQILQNLQNMGSGSGQNLSNADQMGAMALQMAYASGNPEQISKAYLSLYEHNSMLAGAMKKAQEENAVHETPQGPQFGIAGLPGAPFGLSPPAVSSAVANGIVSGRSPQAQGPGAQTAPDQLPPPPTPSQIPQVNASALAQPAPKMSLTASDGKPYVPALAFGAQAPDPSGTPAYKTSNTTTGVAQTKAFMDADIKSNEEIAESAANTNQMLGRLHDISNAYSQAAPGTLVSLDPDLMSKLVSVGAITDKGTINDVSQYQRVMADQALEVLNQLKSATAGAGGSKILNSEVKNATGKLGDPHLQPEAVQDIMGVSTGIANYNKDLANGWDAIGGLGNRVAGGNTLRPSDYQQQFAQSHNLDDYITQAKQTMPQVKGTTSSIPKFNSPSDPLFAQLPSGAKFMDNNGTLRIKH